MHRFLRLLTLVLVLISSQQDVFGQCQQLIFQNPSFEGTPDPHVLPPSWNNCNGTTSDTQPGNWGVTLPPTNGSSYAGLVAVPGWQETASQFLSGCLVAGQTYSFTIDLATFDETSTPGACQGELVLWGGSLTTGGSGCDLNQQLWTSGILPIQTPGFSTTTITFTPTSAWCGLTFQAIDFNCPSGSFYVLIDNISPVTPNIVVTPTITNANCSGGGNGSISLNVTGAANPITYSWSPNVSSTNSATNLAAGNYTVTITDGNNCTVSNTYTVGGSSAPTVTITNPSPNICAGQTVNLTSTVVGGTGAIGYSWAPGGEVTSGISVTPATTTNYTLTVTDAGGCTGTATTTITVTPGAVVNAGPDVSICTGTSTTLNGTGPAPYSWSDGVSVIGATASITVTPASTTTYYLTAGSAGCVDTDTVVVTVSNTFDPTITPAGPYCSTDPSVQMTAVSPGGTWTATCGACITAAGMFNPANASNGNNTITYSASGSCGGTDTEVIVVDIINITNVSSTDINCFGACNGTISITATGATQYSIDGGTTFQASPNFSGLCPATYNIVAQSANGCQVTSTATLLEPAQLTLPTSFVDETCAGACDGTAIVAPQGGVSPYSYSWSNGGGNVPAINNLCSGNYTVTVTDANGCTQNATVTVSGPIALTISSVVAVDETCFGACDGTISITCPGAVSYSIDNGLSFLPTSNFSNLCTGNYPIIAEDANGCQAVSNGIVSGPPEVTAFFIAGPQPTTIYNSTITFANMSSGATNYVWDFAGLGSSTATNPSFAFSDDTAGVYPVCLTATNANGCPDIYCVDIVINDEFVIFVPNAFTPDGDGINDLFFPVCNGVDPTHFEFMVFDRWGELIFSSTSPDGKWDGTHHTVKSKNDVYVWKVRLKDQVTGKKYTYYGHVSLVR